MPDLHAFVLGFLQKRVLIKKFTLESIVEMPEIIAHRGVRNEAPENTESSLRLALELEGISGVEFDVKIDT